MTQHVYETCSSDSDDDTPWDLAVWDEPDHRALFAAVLIEIITTVPRVW